MHHASIRRAAARACALGALALAPLVHAADKGPTIAVLSLVGDQIDVVSFQDQTGSLTDPNIHQRVPFAAAQLDFVALAAAKDVLAEVDPSFDIALLAASKPESYAAQDKLFDGGRAKLPPEVETAVQREHASQLVLVTKYRADARLNVTNGALGNGKIEGLGFCIDYVHRVRDPKTHEVSEGFVAPYAYLQMTLVDAATAKVLRQIAVTDSYTFAPTHGSAKTGPWDALTPAEKVDALKSLVDHEVRDNLARLFPAPAPTARGAQAAQR